MWSIRSILLVAATVTVLAAPGVAGAQGPGSRSTRPPSPVVIQVRRDGFDWRDAGVGAAVLLALEAIGLGLVLVLRDPHGLRSATGRK